MADYTPNPWILDEIAANRKWMVEMMDGMPTECLTSCAKEIESLRAELAKRTDERDEARRRICETTDMTNPNDDCYVRLTPKQIAEHYGWDCYKKPYCFRVNGVVVSKGKAVPPKFELGEDDE
jgi:hypothetical protein